MLTITSLIVSFACLNRLWGADVSASSFLSANHRKVAFAFLVLITVMMYLAVDNFYVPLIALGYLLMRSLPFKVFKGSTTPTTAVAVFGSFLRFSVPIPLLVTYDYFSDYRIDSKALLFCALFAAACTIVSLWYGGVVEHAKEKGEELPWDYNIFVELLHGAFFGASAVTILGLIR